MVSRRLGLEPTLVVATVVSVLGEVARSTATTPAGFLGWSVIALAGMGMGMGMDNVLLPPLVKRYFPDRIGPVTAVHSVAMSFSTAIPPLLAVPLAVLLAAGWVACRPAMLEDTWGGRGPADGSLPLSGDPR